ncbi:MAG: GNAT family N-acetyltransferase [Rhodomicrobium sp.]|nr:GNAT family N-acetyltransferase [Rhodomicrobium sp.]
MAPLTTRRLILRLPAPSDVPALCRIMNDPLIAADYGQITFPCAPISIKRWLGLVRSLQRRTSGLRYVIALKSNPRIIVGGAHISIVNMRDWPQIGYWIGAAHRGKGLASEVARALIATVFRETQLDAVAAVCNAGNHASRRVLHAAGMSRVRRIWLRLHQSRHYGPGLYYRINRHTWQKRNASRAPLAQRIKTRL